MIQKPGITQLSYTGNNLYAQGAILQAGVFTADTFEVSDQAQTALLASRDPVINEVSVGMSGVDTVEERVQGAAPLQITDAVRGNVPYLLTNIIPQQPGTGDPSPDNVRPITGYQTIHLYVEEQYDPAASPKVSVTFGVLGKNLLNKANFVAETPNVTLSQTATGIKLTVTGNGTYRRAVNSNVVDYASVAGKTITLSYHNTNLNGGMARYRIALYRQDGTTTQSLAENAQSTDGNVTKTITVPDNVADAYSLGIVLYANTNDANGASVEYSNLQLEISNSATSYEPFNNTVYSGTYDFVSGVLVVDGISMMITGDDIVSRWAPTATTIGVYTDVANWVYKGLPEAISEGMFSYIRVGAVYNQDTPWVGRFLMNSGSMNRFEMRLPLDVLSSPDLEGAQAYLNDHPLQAFFKIKNPIAYQLDPHTVTVSDGTNYIWTDCGDYIDIVYNKLL